MNLFFFFCFLESGIWNVLLLSTDAMGVKLRFYIASCDFVDRSASLEYKSPKLSLLETRVSSRMWAHVRSINGLVNIVNLTCAKIVNSST